MTGRQWLKDRHAAPVLGVRAKNPFSTDACTPSAAPLLSCALSMPFIRAVSRGHTSVKARLKTGRRQRHMYIERRPQLEGNWYSREVPEAKQAPFRAPFIGHCKFIARDVKWCAFPPVRGLDPDRALQSVRIDTGDIVARTIPVFVQDPADLLRQSCTAECAERDVDRRPASGLLARRIRRLTVPSAMTAPRVMRRFV